MNAWADNPQAAEIDQVIDRAGRVTAEEVAAWPAVWQARFAAFEAAWDVAFDAAWHATRAAAFEAARAVAEDRARSAGPWAAIFMAVTASGALLVRDLIDENTPWDQAAYDLLTAPWRTVIGPIHPDDADLRVQT